MLPEAALCRLSWVDLGRKNMRENILFNIISKCYCHMDKIGDNTIK